MKKDFFTVFRFSWLLLVAVLAIPFVGYGQTATLGCNDNVQISLAETFATNDLASNCGDVTPDNFLEGLIPPGVYFLEVGGSTYRAGSDTDMFALWDVAKAQYVDGSSTMAGTQLVVDFNKFDGQTIQYLIRNADNGNSCWGSVTFELNIIAELELDCPYIAAIHQEEKATIKAGTPYVFDVDAMPMGCQIGAVTVADVGGAQYACDAGDDGIMGTIDDGWCNVICDAVYDPVTNKVTVTVIPASPTAPAVPAGVEVDCTVKVTAPECIECVSWCPGEELTEADIAEELAGTCIASPSQIFKSVTEHGDQCDGVTRVVKFSGLVNQHGQDVLIDLGTQAFKLEPISLFKADGTLDLFTGPTAGSGTMADPFAGSGVIYLPGTNVTLNCDQDPDDFTLTGQPLVVNQHGSDKIPGCKPLTIHYKYVTGIKEDQPVELPNGDWIIVDVLEKEYDEVKVCTCDDIADVLSRYVGADGHAAVGDVVEILNGVTGKDAFLDLAKKECDADKLEELTSTTQYFDYELLTLDELAEYACNTILYTVEDVGEFPACGSGRKFLRNWTLIDWCEGKRAEHTQVIEVKDTKAPVLLIDPDDLTKQTVSTQPWICSGAIDLDGSGLFDDECSGVTVQSEVTDAATGAVVNESQLGPGHYIVSYVGVDECGNTTKPVTQEYEVVDQVKPVPVCEDELVVSVTEDNSADGDGGLAKIYAEAFDAGSHDAGCGPIVRRAVVRMEDWNVAPVTCDPFTTDLVTSSTDKFGTVTETTTTVGAMGPHVKFCCDDADKDDLVVVMRVWDAADNSNLCMVRVTVQNKLTIGCNDTVVDLTCTEYSGNPDDYAKPGTGGSKCVAQDLVLIDEANSINSCGIGTLIRYYSLAGTTQLCTQTINVSGDDAFDPTTIRWPFHYTETVYDAARKEIDDREDSDTYGECIENGREDISLGVLNCGDGMPTCEPTWTDASCGLVGVSVDEEIIEFDEDACYKLIRRWTVVDWCTWEANDGSENLDDENDTDRDTFEACANWCEEDCDRYFFRYTNVDVDGYYTFDQVIKVVDDVAPTASCEVTASALGADCTGSISFSADATDGDACPSQTLTYYWEASNGDSGSGASGSIDELAAGTYSVTFTVTDGCGNSTTTTCEDTIADEKAPTPICYQNISTAIMAGDEPMVEIWANDYIQKGDDNCDDEADLIASFSGTEAVTNMTFTCDDVTGSEIDLQVWLWDTSGNADYCFVTIRVDDNGHCTGDGSAAMISGNIATEFGDDVASAEVMLNSVHPEFPAMRVTQNDGHYAFGGTPLTFDYEISAERNDDYINGVSTLDLVLIQKHILGLATLDSPYKVIAADVNSDQRVTAADLVQLRQLILGVTSELPDNDSWRFVDAGQAFGVATNPWPFTEIIDITGLNTNMTSEDFVGVKIGDVNANAQANSLMSTEVRSNGTLTLNMIDAQVNAGEVVSVDVTSENFNEVFGYQLTMNHTGLTLTSVDAGTLEISDANIGVREGLLTMSWNSTEAVSTTGVLFTLNFSATENVQLSNAININSRITTAEAYTGLELANNDIALTFTQGENTIVATEYDLYQNEPNPFRAYTDVSFVMPNSGQATLSVIDVTGKLVRQVQDQFNKGVNTVRFTKADLGAASGILYYKLESGEFTATKKMIVIE